MYADDQAALNAVREDYLYWSGKLTDTSLQLSFAILGANWATFGSVNGIMSVLWAKLSVACVVLSLGVNVVGAAVLAELHRRQLEYAESDKSRWAKEFVDAQQRACPWPFTPAIEVLGRGCRELKAWLPVTAGLLYFAALIFR